MRDQLIKICGLSTPDTMQAALDAGATHVGLVHYQPSPRHIELADASRLRAMARGRAKVVLLLVNADIETTSAAIEAIKPEVVQFHGTETPEWCALVRKQVNIEVWKALGVKDRPTLDKSARYIGQQFEDDVNQLSLADAFTIDGRMSLAMNDRLLVEARVENLFDARVEAAISSNGIIERAFPRTFWIGLRARFE